MAGGKQTPRQKMIGMMYLVLTALLALNVSVEVLDAFVLVNDGLEKTNKNFTAKVDQVYDDFNRQRAMSADKVEPYYTKAFEVKALADSLVNFILFSRAEMISTVDGIPIEQADTLRLIDLAKKDNYSGSSRYWVTEGNQDPTITGGAGTRANTLREMIANFKEEITLKVPENWRPLLQLGLDLEGPFYGKDKVTEITWQQAMFDRVIPVAAATNLSRLVTEVRNAEFDVISMLYGAITADDFKFDQITARVVPSSHIVLLNDYYEADIFVAAFDSKQNPEVVVDGRPVESREGVGKLRRQATAEGLQKYRGMIRVISPSGVPQEYPFEGEYIVQRPAVTVSADAMNVFYMGVDNPVSISVPGVASENIRPVISGAGNQLVPRGRGQYTVRLGRDQNVNQPVRITVNALVDNQTRPMGTAEFRVRRVPDPYAEIAGQNEGTIAREVLAGAPLIPRMRDFDFKMDFRITSFSMNTTVSGDFREFRSTGNVQTREMEEAIRRSTRGQRFTFDNIQAVGDDGSTRNLPPMVFRIQ